MKRAWRTVWGGIASIVAAETRGKARAVVVKAALEVYDHRQVKFSDVKAKRASEYDAWAEVDSTGSAWDELQVARACRGAF